MEAGVISSILQGFNAEDRLGQSSRKPKRKSKYWTQKNTPYRFSKKPTHSFVYLLNLIRRQGI